jgi:hypothetical protein
MKRQVILPKVMFISLFFLLVSSLSAENSDQWKAISQLKAKFGTDAVITFTGDNAILHNLDWINTEYKVTDLVSARETADKILKELEPFINVNITQFDSIEVKVLNFKSNEYVVEYFQTKLDGINYENRPSVFFVFSHYSSDLFSFGNAFYSIKVPDRPYVSYDRLNEIAKTEHTCPIGYVEDLDHTRHKVVPVIDLLICMFEDNNIRTYRVAYVIKYLDGYRIYVDAKTGEIIKQYYYGCY